MSNLVLIERTLLYAATGEAISEWANVERLLCKVFQHSLEPCSSSAAEEVYYSIENFRARLLAVDAAFKNKLPTPQQQGVWSEVLTACQSSSKIRNLMAHGAAEFDDSAPYSLKGRLHPSAKPPKTKQGSATTREIAGYGIRFSNLSKELEVFVEFLNGRGMPPQLSSVSAVDPPTYREIRNRYLGIPEAPRSPSRAKQSPLHTRKKLRAI